MGDTYFGKGRKFNFFHILMLDKVGYNLKSLYNFFSKISFHFKETCKYWKSVKITIWDTKILVAFVHLVCKNKSFYCVSSTKTIFCIIFKDMLE